MPEKTFDTTNLTLLNFLLRFPRDPKRRILWINLLNIDPSKVLSHTVICSKHFKKEYINASCADVIRLLPNALPTVRNKLYIKLHV